VVDDVFDKFGGNFYYVGQFRKGNFRFYLPEFRSVACSVAVFRTECGTECINFAECHCHYLTFQLTGNGEPRTLSEKVLGVVLFGSFDGGVKPDGGYLENFSRTLAVAAGDYRGVYVHEISFLKETVNGRRQLASHTDNCVRSEEHTSELQSRF